MCLHGFPQTGRLWEKLGCFIGERYTLIAPDLRGVGESQRPSDGYDKKALASDLIELLNSLGIDAIHVVGHDIGAAVAYSFASQWPKRTRTLTMVEMLLPGFGLEQMYAIRKPGEFAHMPFFMVPDLPEWLISGHEKPFLDWFIRNMVSDQSSFASQDIEAYAEEYSRPGALRASFDMYRAFWQDAEDNRVFARTKLSMPVLAIGASLSLGRALELSLKPLTKNLRGLVFEHSGHFIPDEQPRRLAHELTGFYTA